MPTRTKAKNGNGAADTMADMADKMAQETKVFTETWLEAGHKATEETKAVVDTQRKLFKEGLATWQKYTQTYFESVADATQHMMDESLAVRARFGKIVESNLKQSQGLMAAEQETALEMTQAFQAQVQTASERLVKLFAPNWPK